MTNDSHSDWTVTLDWFGYELLCEYPVLDGVSILIFRTCGYDSLQAGKNGNHYGYILNIGNVLSYLAHQIKREQMRIDNGKEPWSPLHRFHGPYGLYRHLMALGLDPKTSEAEEKAKPFKEVLETSRSLA